MSKVTSVRLSDELAVRLDQLAASLDRPKAWLIEQAIARYGSEEAWEITAITEALAEYRTEGVALRSHDEVMERLEAKLRAGTTDVSPLA